PSATRRSSPCTRTASRSSRSSSIWATRHRARPSVPSGPWPRCRCCATRRAIARWRNRRSSSNSWTRNGGPTRFLPADADRAWQTRMWDRFYDHYVQEPMQKIVADRLRPEGKTDAYGVELAKGQLRQAYGVTEREMESKTWAIGDDFTLADCAAAPALFYANTVVPFAETHENLAAYLDRLMA